MRRVSGRTVLLAKADEASLIVGLILSYDFASCSFANLLMHISSHVAVATTAGGTEPQFVLNICPKRPAISSNNVVLTSGLVSCSAVLMGGLVSRSASRTG
jgi:hypothetical protein